MIEEKYIVTEISHLELYQYKSVKFNKKSEINSGGGIRTHEPLKEQIAHFEQFEYLESVAVDRAGLLRCCFTNPVIFCIDFSLSILS